MLPLSLEAQNGAESWFRANIFRSSGERVNHHHYLGETGAGRQNRTAAQTLATSRSTTNLCTHIWCLMRVSNPRVPEEYRFTDGADSLTAY